MVLSLLPEGCKYFVGFRIQVSGLNLAEFPSKFRV